MGIEIFTSPHHWRSIDAPVATTILTWIGMSHCFGVEKKKELAAIMSIRERCIVHL